jgi:hypothetical protein
MNLKHYESVRLVQSQAPQLIRLPTKRTLQNCMTAHESISKSMPSLVAKAAFHTDLLM